MERKIRINFNEYEKNVLVELLKLNPILLENKRDNSFIIKKKQTWEKVMEIFNKSNDKK